jgi:glutamate-5-semialdehyde dehydrogenase
MSYLEMMGEKAQKAAKHFALVSSELKNSVIIHLTDNLLVRADEIITANALDISTGKDADLSEAMIDRLTLNQSRLEEIVENLRDVANLPDPVGEVFDENTLPNGLRVRKQRVPLGVLGVIYEARPNVTLDIAVLAIKTGNAVILRGSGDTINSNRALVAEIQESLMKCGLPKEVVQFVDDPNRERVVELLRMHQYIDMLIPRGGASLHKYCRENSSIPVITGGIGICHLFVDQSVDVDAAIQVIQNAKVQRPSVCNSLDTVLIHRAIAEDFLPLLVNRLVEHGVNFRAHESVLPFLKMFSKEANIKELFPAVEPAGPDDFDTEWLSLVLGLKVVDDLDEAINHIGSHSTGHSDGILTRNGENANKFIVEVDSAAVYVNASTRFTDGGQLGLGAEVAISTQRLHARGPMGLRELTTYKWVIEGDYHVRG